jgi:hypothetical protein
MKDVIDVDGWARIRRLRRSAGVSIKGDSRVTHIALPSVVPVMAHHGSLTGEMRVRGRFHGPDVARPFPEPVVAVPSLSFEDLYARERPSTLAVVATLTGDRAAAEDITQEAFATALRKWSRIANYDRASGCDGWPSTAPSRGSGAEPPRPGPSRRRSASSMPRNRVRCSPATSSWR